MSGESFKILSHVWKTMVTTKGFDRVLKSLTIVSAGDGKCSAEFTVTEDLTNRGSSLHGGCSATIVDIVSTMALMSNKDTPPGVSVNMNINYMKAAKEGEEVRVDSQTVKLGKTLAFLEVQIKKKSDGALIATGTHTKFIGSS